VADSFQLGPSGAVSGDTQGNSEIVDAGDIVVDSFDLFFVLVGEADKLASQIR